MNVQVTRKTYWLVGAAAVIVLLVAITTLHLGTQISPSAQRTLYRQTEAVVTAERGYAVAHGGQYTAEMADLATAYPQLAYIIEQNSPVAQYSPDAKLHGYYLELANQSTGGAASFSVLVSDNATSVLTCTGPGPLCSNGKFTLPRSDFALDTESQRVLYRQTVMLLSAESRYAAQSGGQYASTLDLATSVKGLAFALGPNSPINQFYVDSTGHGYYTDLTNQSTGGSASFAALVPDHGSAVLTCVGAAPLCTRGTFHVPRGTLR